MHRLLLAIALLGGLLVAPTGAYARGADPDGPTYQMPNVGDCFAATYDEYMQLSEPTPHVNCAERHTGLVVAVVAMPADTDWNTDSDDIREAVDEYCVPTFYETIHRPFRVVAKTGYASWIWIPSEEQRSHGASWLRCDIVLPSYDRVAPLPDPLLKSNRVPPRLRTCLQVVDPDLWFPSTCGGEHNYRFEKVWVVPGVGFPSNSAFLKFGRSHCPRTQHNDPWFATWGRPATWAYGDHTLVCYREA